MHNNYRMTLSAFTKGLSNSFAWTVNLDISIFNINMAFSLIKCYRRHVLYLNLICPHKDASWLNGLTKTPFWLEKMIDAKLFSSNLETISESFLVKPLLKQRP